MAIRRHISPHKRHGYDLNFNFDLWGRRKLSPLERQNVAVLHLAIKANDINAVRDFIRVKDLATAPDSNGRTALHWAVAFGNPDTARLVMRYFDHSKVNSADRNGRTAIHYAAMAGKNDLVKILFIKGAHVNAKDRQGMTPLHYAAQNSNPFLIHSLLARGADKHVRDRNRRLPYDVAVLYKAPLGITQRLDPESVEELQASTAMANNDPAPMYYGDAADGKNYAINSSVISSGGKAPPLRLPSSILAVKQSRPPTLQNRDLIPRPMPGERSMEVLVKMEMEREAGKARDYLLTQLHMGGYSKRLFKVEESDEHEQLKAMALEALVARQKRRAMEYQHQRLAERSRLRRLRENRVKPVARSPLWAPKSGEIRGQHSRAQPMIQTAYYPRNTVVTKTNWERNYPQIDNRMSRSNCIQGQTMGEPFRSEKTRRPYYGIRDKRVVIVKPQPYTYPFLRDPIRLPSPQRLALTEFRGTSDRVNYLNVEGRPSVHQCVDRGKLEQQWL